jgi:hypothetical protein
MSQTASKRVPMPDTVSATCFDGGRGDERGSFRYHRCTQRKWARMSTRAQMKTPMTMDDHHNSRWIAEPLRLPDCCLVTA